jgi:two-component system response regulator RegA
MERLGELATHLRLPPGAALVADASRVASDPCAAARPLLLADQEPGSRQLLRRLLAPAGFAVTSVDGAAAALEAVAEARFDYAVVELRPGRDGGLGLVRELRRLGGGGMRIVVVTGFDSFASVVLALRAGADDYLAKPVHERQLLDALLDRGPAGAVPPVPETPLGLSRVAWEHIQRIFEQCGRNVTATALRLGMHRRTLQRMLGKRAPPPRAQADRAFG